MFFVIAYKKNNKYLLKIGLDDGKEVWAETTEAVYNFAKKNFEKNEKCSFEYEVENGKYSVSRIKKGGSSVKKKTTSSSSSQPTCSDCGKDLKDDKYEKCYTCNQKNPVKKAGKKSSGKSTETSEQIKRLSVLRASCDAILVLQGQIGDVEALADMVETLYDRFYSKVNG